VSARRVLGRPRRAAPSRTLGEVLLRQRELRLRAAVQREALATHAAELAPAFAAADKVVGMGRSLLAHPVLLAVAGGLLVVLWPRRAFAAIAKGFALWNGLGAVRRLVER
jgi:hypothetical protein